MTAHVIKWYSAAPFWPDDELSGIQAGFDRPAILRFATDDFMDEFLAALALDPARLRGLAVQQETWRTPLGAAPAASTSERLQIQPPQSLFLSRLKLERDRRAGIRALPAIAAPAKGPYQLKLYQPVHQRYYLVVGSLACEMPGLPDRKVNASQKESVSFVLRRLFPKAGLADQPDDPLPPYDPSVETGSDVAARQYEEYACVQGSGGVQWQRLDDPAALAANEQRLPLFPADCNQQSVPRRIFAGLVPAGKRDTYLATPRAAAQANQETGPAAALGEDARLLLFKSSLLEPWKALIARADQVKTSNIDPGSPNPAPDPQLKNSRVALCRGDIQQNSWLLLVDWVDWLADNLPNGLRAIRAGDTALTGPVGDLVRVLFATSLPAGLIDEIAAPLSSGKPASVYRANAPANLAQAIGRMADFLAGNGNREQLESQVHSFPFPDAHATALVAGWPDFLFLFADPGNPTDSPSAQHNLLPPSSLGSPIGFTPTELSQSSVDLLFKPACAALGIAADPALPVSAGAASQAPDMREGWFVLRCVYERPNCGPLHPVVVSLPTCAFQIAGYFDPDAPARPLRIGLPIDTTPAGLRKFDRKTMFMVSDILCGQIDRMRGLTFGDLVLQVLPWPFHKDISLGERAPCKSPSGASLGLMCSLSIPIITLCALILLMIMVSLLDFVFRWLPYFIICLPIPGFKGKR